MSTIHGNWSKYCLFVMLLVLQTYQMEGCLEEERLGLLQIKTFMKSRNEWPKNENAENCCAWERVQCDLSTGRVTKLDLSSMMMGSHNGPLFEDDDDKLRVFNVTLLHPFQQLMSLDLSKNSINGLLEANEFAKLEHLRLLNLTYNAFGHELFANLTNLTKLEVLDVSSSELGGSVEELAKLTNLQELYLEHNFELGGPIQGLCKLKNIQKLYLGDNSFEGNLPSCLFSMTSLRELDLSYNDLSGKFPKILENFATSLEYLDLSYNLIEGKLSLSWFANYSRLQNLQLSRNNLEVHTEDSFWQPKFQLQSLGLRGCSLNNPNGVIPTFLSQQNHISDINLSNNRLVGAFPTWLLDNKPHLRVLGLENNSLAGCLHLPIDIQYPLEELDISMNNFHCTLPQDIGLAFPNLTKLILNDNHFEGNIPTSIAGMSKIKELDLSSNNFSGEFPRQLLIECQALESLVLSDNHLEGEIFLDNMNLTQLRWLFLNNNSFSGTIKDGLSKSTILQGLDISSNKITGRLPSWIGSLLRDLEYLSMPSNFIEGEIPVEICNLYNLWYLDLSRNKLIGDIPLSSTLCKFETLYYLSLSQNKLTGSIPDIMWTSESIGVLDLSYNQLSGLIPLQPLINTNLSSLTVVSLAGNNLSGPIPHQICELSNINMLTLSGNQLTGRIPTCLGNMSFGSIVSDYLTTMQVALQVKNQHISYTRGSLVLISGLDLSSNQLTGVIPSQLGKLEKMTSLNLSNNWLSGPIPISFTNLKNIESMDLSYNNLSGIIPSKLVDLNFLAIFNVSYNNLTGKTPETGQFGSFDQDSYLGNPGLCGSRLEKSCDPHKIPDHSTGNGTKKEEGDSDTTLFIQDFFWTFGVSSFITFIATIAVLCINPQWRGAWFDFLDWHVLWWLY